MANLQSNLANLNDKQREAVMTTEGPVLIAAGAGSGKTRVLTHRIAYLIEVKQVNPWNILAITFTNKAANEMRERVNQLVEEDAESIWVSTFHSMCARILRREAEKVGYQRNFSIIDTSEQETVMKQVLKEMDLDSTRYDYRYMLACIDDAKNRGIDPQTFKDSAHNYLDEIVSRAYSGYQRRLKSSNAMDFNDLIRLTVKLLEDHEEVRQFYQQKFQYIHVDEYQDTNESQYQLIKLLTSLLRNVCVVGDADQSIYGWRGANMENILNFENDYPDATVILLEQNYRSTPTILSAANSVISHNINRQVKDLWSDRPDGSKIQFYLAETDSEEAEFVVKQITELKNNQGYHLDDFAVLYRTQSQSRSLEQAFSKANLPYKIVAGLKFYSRKEIQDTLAYLRLINNSNDTISFNRIVNVPKRGIGAVTIDKLTQFAQSQQASLFDAIDLLTTDVMGNAPIQKLQAFKALIDDLKKQAEFLSMTELVEAIWLRTEYIDKLEEAGTIDAENRIENLKEFASVSRQFDEEHKELPAIDPDLQTDEEAITEDKLTLFLTDLSLATDNEQDDSQASVSLMTLHAAKGLEFPVVFLVGLEEGLFPLSRAMENIDELEEERRLAYVGMTRAEDVLYLTAARSRLLYGKYQYHLPSRFIKEIDTELIEQTGSNANQWKTMPRGGRTLENQARSRRAARRTTLANHKVQRRTRKLNDQPTDDVQWQVGDKVDHRVWGQGTVVSMKGDGDNLTLSVAFANQGIKSLLVGIAPIKKID